MRIRLTVTVLLALCAFVTAAEAPKLPIPQLLNPETRMEAFRDFCVRENPGSGEHESSDLKSFAEFHAGLRVLELKHADGRSGYLLTWHLALGSHEWDDILTTDAQPQIVEPPVLYPCERGCYRIFSPEGGPLGPAWSLMDGVVTDLLGDGHVYAVEHSTTLPMGGKITGEYLKVYRLDADEKPILAILYNAHPPERAGGNTWSFQVVPVAGGLHEIQLGPVKGLAGVEPKAIFRWDRTANKWVGPPAKPDAHFKIITGHSSEEELQRILKTNAFRYPLIAPSADAPLELPGDFGWHVDDLLPESLSKPYRRRSLAGLSDAKIFNFMALNQTAWDYAREKMEKETTVPDFWELDAQTAALAYVKRNRSRESENRFILAFSNPRNESAPDEGDLTLDYGSANCTARNGSWVSQLHCAREGSFFACVAYSEPPRWEPGQGTYFNFQKLDIPYPVARHIFQVAWWLGRIRSRQYANGGQSDGGMSGFATMDLTSGEHEMSVSNFCEFGRIGSFRGFSEMGETYSTSAYLSLVIQLFERELPGRLGKSWELAAVTSGQCGGKRPGAAWSPEEFERISGAAGALLCLACERRLAPCVAAKIATIVRRMKWKGPIRTGVENLLPSLPPPSAYEKSLAAIDAVITAWAKSNPDIDASDSGYHSRQSGVDALPVPGVDEQKKTPLSAKSPGPAAAVDALHKQRDDLESQTLESLKDIAGLRKQVSEILREWECNNDPDALEKWAAESPDAAVVAIWRLEKIAPERAVDWYRKQVATGKTVQERQNAEGDLQRVEAEVKSTKMREAIGRDGLTAGIRGELLATMMDDNAEYQYRKQAMDMLVPPENPKCHPDSEIDDALIAMLARKYPVEGAPLALAARLGGKSWDALSAYAQKPGSFDLPNLAHALPALVSIAVEDPRKYQDRLEALIMPEFHASKGDLNETLWAAWLLDLRDLKSDIERLATSGPDDFEGTLASSSGNHSRPVNQRFHRARRIAALWNEKDPFTKARLLVAFAIAESEMFSTHPGSDVQLRKQLAAACSSLTLHECTALNKFASWCEAKATEENPESSSAIHAAARIVQEALLDGVRAGATAPAL